MQIEKITVKSDGKVPVFASVPEIICKEHPEKARRINGLYKKSLVKGLERLAKKLGSGELFCDYITEISGEFLTFVFTVTYKRRSLEFADSYKNLELFVPKRSDKAMLRARAANIAARRRRLGEPMYADAEKIAAKKLSAAMMIPCADGMRLVYPAGLLAPEKTVIFVKAELG